MKYVSLILLLWMSCFTGFSQSVLYVAPNGSSSNSGSISSPTTLANAIANINSGGTIYVRGGTYSQSSTLIINRANGSSSSNTKLIAYNSEVPVINFSSQSESSSNRGFVLDADYWYVKGLIVEEAGDNGMLLSGNHNTIESSIFRKNHDTGLQLSRYNTSDNSIGSWPAYNLILNCEAYDNRDSDNEDADGFAAKLTVGVGNVFRNCVSHHNIDDGWDLYTKTETGPIGAITLENCVAHSNGVLTSGSTSGNGDKNGFKLGGEDISVNHVLRRCVAFNNGKHGFTYNRNLGSIEVTNCTGYNNEERNFNFDGGSSVFKNNVSYQTGSNDRLIGNSSYPNAFDNDDNWGFSVSSSDFQSLNVSSNASPLSGGFLNLSSNSDLIDGGVSTSGISYNGSAPDLGAVESGGSSPSPTYSLSVNASPSNGGSVSVSPNKSAYQPGETVSVSASAASGFTFSGWSGASSSSSTSISVVMNSNLSLTANFASDNGGGGGGDPSAGTVRIEDSASPSTGLCSYDGSLKSYSNADNGNAINLSNSSGKSIIWKVNAGTSGNYTLKWRYVNGGTQASTLANLLINNSASGTVNFTKTSDKSTFVTVSVTKYLNQGVNEIEISTAQDGEFADVDWIEVSGNGIAYANCAADNGSGGGQNPDPDPDPEPGNGEVSLSANAAGSTVNLAWSIQDIDVRAVEVYRDTDSDPSGRVRIASVSSTTRSYSDNTAAAGTTYYYWIKVTDFNLVVYNSNGASATVSGDNGGGNGGDYDFGLYGWATQNGGTTGGAGGPEVIVSTGQQLQDAIDQGGPRIIYVQGVITSAPDGKINVKDVSDITILGLGSGAEFNNVGIKIYRASNVIVKNLRIHHVTSGDKDCISIEGPADHVWIDHCELYNEYTGVDKDYYDGLLDSKRDSDYITYSWNYLHDSWKTSLNGSSESDDYNRHITYHHNYFRNCHSRLPLWRGGQGHLFNNYYEDIFSTAINSRIGACLKIENNYFDNVLNPYVTAYSDEYGYGETVGNVLVNSSFEYSSDTHELPYCSPSIPYSYSSVLNSGADVPNIVGGNAGVGVLYIQASALASRMASPSSTILSGLNAYPNPMGDELTVKFSLSQQSEVAVSLFDMVGNQVLDINNEVLNAGNHEIQVKREGIKSGIYMLNVKTKDGILKTKLIVK